MLRKKLKLLSLIVPVYKQEKVIAQNLRSIVAELDTLGIDYEIIVVVDGYMDRSREEVSKVTSPHIVITGYATNHGKGYAVRFGMAKSHGDIIGFIDAGGDLKSEGISILLAHFNWYNADCIIGSKRHPASKVEYPFFRKVLSFGYQVLVKILFGLNIRDSQVGLKLYRRVVLEDVLPRLLVKEFAFDIEILSVAHRLGYTRIYEAPVELTFGGVSSITSKNFWNIIANVLWETLAVFYRLRILHYYDNVNKRKWLFDPELNFRINTG
ncbi:MAG: glycosyltransferase [Candidatus Gottesmanbacteria bacterium]|nr:glycosyltransferase [Candidatus Gottesmanbacteria bacterium]